MKHNHILKIVYVLLLLAALVIPPAGLRQVYAARQPEVTAFDLILAMNSLRVGLGNAALIEDPLVDALAQSTANYMAANQMSGHIGNVSGRLTALGYGGGSRVWATENFAVGNMSIDEIMLVWSDPDHMLPAVMQAYCHVGAGTAKSANGMTYYVLQAAYSDGKFCGPYAPPGGNKTPKPGDNNTPRPGDPTASPFVSQYIVPVKIVTPDAEGRVFHVVQPGQTFWAIAIAYKITIKDLKGWNNLGEAAVLKSGQKLFIPGSNTVGYATPTQPGAILVVTPDADGRVVHVVQTYQTLTTISIAYGTTIQRLLNLNGLQIDTPLRVGQKLLIDPGNLTPSATLAPIQRLTPAEDGRYYHIVQSGETLSWIATRYGLRVADLIAWNGLSAASVIIPNQKLLLQVTPPATETNTPLPPSSTPIPTKSPAPTDTSAPVQPTATLVPQTAQPTVSLTLFLGVVFLLIVLGLVFYFSQNRKKG